MSESSHFVCFESASHHFFRDRLLLDLLQRSFPAVPPAVGVALWHFLSLCSLASGVVLQLPPLSLPSLYSGVSSVCSDLQLSNLLLFEELLFFFPNGCVSVTVSGLRFQFSVLRH